MYPEHNKLKARSEENLTLSEFLEWCSLRGYDMVGENYVTVRPAEILAQYFGVDAKKLEAEKRQMLAAYQIGF